MINTLEVGSFSRNALAAAKEAVPPPIKTYGAKPSNNNKVTNDAFDYSTWDIRNVIYFINLNNRIGSSCTFLSIIRQSISRY